MYILCPQIHAIAKTELFAVVITNQMKFKCAQQSRKYFKDESIFLLFKNFLKNFIITVQESWHCKNDKDAYTVLVL